MDYDNIGLFFWLDVIANLTQLESYRMNLEEIGNEQLMEELQKQDKLLNNQVVEYLKKIIKNQEEILKLLQKE